METRVVNIHLFNCDKTYDLDVVQMLFADIQEKLSFQISVTVHYFPLPEMSELCSTKIPELQMDHAVFVVHANESRLSINEENAGIGYARIYRALQKKTGENVLIVIGGDNNYRDENEKDKNVISRWARRKILSQFTEEFLDGRKSFIFSWDTKHRPIHEEAILHYLDPKKVGQKFVPRPVPQPKLEPKPQPMAEVEPPPTNREIPQPHHGSGNRGPGGAGQRPLTPSSGEEFPDVERNVTRHSGSSFWSRLKAFCVIL